jgi:hypothetical protein
LLLKGDIKEAEAMVKRMYSKEENASEIVAYIGKTSQKETSKVSYKDSLMHPMYRYATLIIIIVITFHELSGYISAVYVLSLFKRRQLLIPGHFLMAFADILVGVFAYYNYDMGVLIFMMVYILFY